MGSSLAPPQDLIQRMTVALKRWLQGVMPSSITCGHPLGEYVDGRTSSAVTTGKGRKLKAGIVGKLEAGIAGKTRTPRGAAGKPRALEALIARKHRAPIRLAGRTGGIECTVSIGGKGDVDVLFKGLPGCLVGTRPILAFPAAARIDTIAWESGSSPGIVQAVDAVTTTGELECRVARLTSETEELPALFGRIRIMSPEGDAQPACSIGVAVEELGD